MEESKENSTQEAKSKDKRNQRNYPRILLETCLIVAQKIRELNGGNPWTPEEVGKAIGIAKTRNGFVYYVGSSRDFGLTSGTRHSETIKIEKLGRDILYADTPEIEKRKKVEAFFSVDIFKKVYDHYKSGNLPEMKYLSNTLEGKFQIPPEFHEEFREVFIKKCQDLGLGEQTNPIIGDEESEDVQQIELTTPKTKTGLVKKSVNRIFVAIPFSERNEDRAKGFFKEVLNSLITPAVERLDLKRIQQISKGVTLFTLQ